MNQYYQYYVEGETEEKILEVLKTDFRYIMPGKVKVFNVIEEKFSRSKLISLKRKTNVVLVFDTDSSDSSTLRANISFLERQSVVRQVICIPQVKNLEEELIRCCNIRKIKELLSSKFDSNFKNDLCNCNGLMGAMLRHEFNMELFWSSAPSGEFSSIPNNSNSIRL